MSAIVKSKKLHLKRELNECRWPRCDADAAFGLLGGHRPFYCSVHAAPFPQLAPVAIPKCHACDAPAVLGVTDKDAPTLCRKHSGDASRIPILNQCASCCKRASYGPPTVPRGESYACLCATHGKMVATFMDVVSPVCTACLESGELTVPWFGPAEGRVKRVRCAKHKLEGDVDHGKTPKCVTCLAEGKNVDASYCEEGETDVRKANAKYCREHRPNTAAVSVANYKCDECGIFAVKVQGNKCAQCTKGIPTEHRRTKTQDGAKRGDRLVSASASPSRVAEVKARGEGVRHAGGDGYACHEPGCTSHAFSGVGAFKTHCAKHKPLGAKWLGSGSWCLTCKVMGVSRFATHAIRLGLRPIRCAGHAEPGMVSVKLRYKCVICLTKPVRDKTQTCFECRQELPRTKEAECAVAAALERANLGVLTLALRDRAVPCRPQDMSAFRPDFVWLLEDRVIVLEVDENAHRNYEPVCEVGRLHQLHEAFAPLPLFVLRYNPHAEGAAESGHAIVVSKVQMLFVRALPDTGLHVEYEGYSHDQIADLDAVENELHAATEALAVESARKRARVDAFEKAM